MGLRRATLPALAVSAVLALGACGSSTSGAAGGAPAKPLVVTSTDVYGAVVRAVGGDDVEVVAIVDSPDADPHEYESTPADAVSVTRAQLVVYNGGGYDDFAPRLVESSGAQVRTIDVAALSGLEAQVPAGEEFNEHVWYSLPTVERLAERVATDLGAVDPARASTYTANAAAFGTRVDGLVAELDGIRAAHAGARVAVTEPVPLYLVAAAGLEDATPEEFSEAVEEGTDPPAAVLADTLELFQGPEPVRALLANAQTESPATQQVERAATAAGAPIVRVTETLPADVDDYTAWMGQQIGALRAALDRR